MKAAEHIATEATSERDIGASPPLAKTMMYARAKHATTKSQMKIVSLAPLILSTAMSWSVLGAAAVAFLSQRATSQGLIIAAVGSTMVIITWARVIRWYLQEPTYKNHTQTAATPNDFI